MNAEEIKQYTTLSHSKSVTIDRSIVSDYPQYVRDTIIYDLYSARIEFNDYNMDEGPLYIRVSYATLPDMIRSLESYLGKPIDQWENYNRTGAYPDRPEPSQPAAEDKLHSDYIHKQLPLPPNTSAIVFMGVYAT